MTFDEWFRAVVIVAKEHGALNLLREQEDYRPGYNEGLSPEQEVQIVIEKANT
jgi:hypothetical protein